MLASTRAVERLHAAGAAIARIHSIPASPHVHLPHRARPIAVDDFASDRRLGRMPTTPLLDAGHERIHALPVPSVPWVFLHGDVWPGQPGVDGR